MQPNTSKQRELRILQMNIHKSKTAAFNLINEPNGQDALSNKFDIIYLQEPWTDCVGNTHKGHNWDMIYPTSRLQLGDNILLQSIILINCNISTRNSWTKCGCSKGIHGKAGGRLQVVW